MDQYMFLNYVIVKDNTSYQLLMAPQRPFEEVQAVLDQFKVDFAQMQQDQIAKIAEAKAKADSSESVVEPVELQPELVEQN
jgi:hypothetical protein